MRFRVCSSISWCLLCWKC